jgi:hypothetical protein
MSTPVLIQIQPRVAAKTTVNKAPKKITTSQEKALVSTSQKKTAKTPTPLPPRLKYPKQWKDLRAAPIACAGGAGQTVVSAGPGMRLFISSITFTVAAETNVTLRFGNYGGSGPMDFGGADEPRAITMNLAESPAPCGNGSFSISSLTAGGDVNGFVIYYREEDETP